MKKVLMKSTSFILAVMMIVTLIPAVSPIYAASKSMLETDPVDLPGAVEQQGSEDPFLIYLEQQAGEMEQQDVPSAKAVKRAEGVTEKSAAGEGKAGTAGSNLNGPSRAIYDYLRVQFELIAKGEEASSSISIPSSVIWPEHNQWINGSIPYWTSDDLGGNVIVEGDKINQAALDEFKETYYFDFEKIITALLADCPYTLYWFDKTALLYPPEDGIISARYDQKIQDYVLTFSQQATFNFPVSREYSASGELGTFTVDTAIGRSSQTIVSNAEAIVSQYASATDYQKLKGYCDAICSLVSYNWDAARIDMDYGNPWQLIWVFDKDSSTNVVCEGYAKAFQLLCDLSDFNDDIDSIIATGVMRSESRLEGHMWNIVKMDDGANYLMDVTNCDSGDSGAPYALFLAGYISGNLSEGYAYRREGTNLVYAYDSDTALIYDVDQITMSGQKYEEHIWGEGEITTAPTCTEPGIRMFTCIKCGEHYSETIPATGHTEEVIPAVPATCTEGGLTTGEKCTVCGAVLREPAATKALGHSWGSWTTVKEATLVKEGLQRRICKRDPSHIEERVVPKLSLKGTSIVSLTAAKKGFTVKWKKQSVKTTGYQIQIATNSKFTKGKKLYTISKTSTVSKKITKLKAKKRYYVRVRTYKTISGVKYYSKWSSVKSIRTR